MLPNGVDTAVRNIYRTFAPRARRLSQSSMLDGGILIAFAKYGIVQVCDRGFRVG